MVKVGSKPWSMERIICPFERMDDITMTLLE